jgi:hypothetical protein
MNTLPDSITRCLTPDPEVVEVVLEEEFLLMLLDAHRFVLGLQQECET